MSKDARRARSLRDAARAAPASAPEVQHAAFLSAASALVAGVCAPAAAALGMRARLFANKLPFVMPAGTLAVRRSCFLGLFLSFLVSGVIN